MNHVITPAVMCVTHAVAAVGIVIYGNGGSDTTIAFAQFAGAALYGVIAMAVHIVRG